MFKKERKNFIDDEMSKDILIKFIWHLLDENETLKKQIEEKDALFEEIKGFLDEAEKTSKEISEAWWCYKDYTHKIEKERDELLEDNVVLSKKLWEMLSKKWSGPSEKKPNKKHK